MIIKQVKEYSKRKRIEINKTDNIDAGAKVIILSENEYKELQNKVNDYDALLKENQILQKQENNLKEIIKDVTAPIYENHQKELENKDQQIKQLQVQLKLLQTKANQFNLDMQGLNIIELSILRKHKKLIQQFNTAIAGADDVPAGNEIIPADVKKID